MNVSQGSVERYLAALADFTRRRRLLVVGAWAALLLGGAWFAAHQFDRLSSGGWNVPGSQSATAATLLERFPERDGAQLAVLVEASSAERVEAVLGRTRTALSSFSDVRIAGSAERFENGTAAVLPSSTSATRTTRSHEDVHCARRSCSMRRGRR